MFSFFHKRLEKRQAAETRTQIFNQIAAEPAKANKLEAALVLHLLQDNQESITRWLDTFGKADVWLLNKTGERFGDPVMTKGANGDPYVAVFTSCERAAAAGAEWKAPHRPAAVSSLELVFALTPFTGIVLNAHEPHFQWSFNPQQVENLRKVYETGHPYDAGSIFTVWSKNAYRAVKLLRADEGGVHLRLYANTWPERPETLDPATLTLDSAGPGSELSIGHLPMVRSTFLEMGPRPIATAPVEESELEGYHIWAEDNGGYFGG